MENTTDEELKIWIDSKTKSKPMKKTKEQLSKDEALKNIDMENLDNIEKEPLRFIMTFALKRLSPEQFEELEKWCDSYRSESLLLTNINWDEIEKEWNKSQGLPATSTHMPSWNLIQFIKSKLQP